MCYLQFSIVGIVTVSWTPAFFSVLQPLVDNLLYWFHGTRHAETNNNWLNIQRLVVVKGHKVIIFFIHSFNPVLVQSERIFNKIRHCVYLSMFFFGNDYLDSWKTEAAKVNDYCLRNLWYFRWFSPRVICYTGSIE